MLEYRQRAWPPEFALAAAATMATSDLRFFCMALWCGSAVGQIREIGFTFGTTLRPAGPEMNAFAKLPSITSAAPPLAWVFLFLANPPGGVSPFHGRNKLEEVITPQKLWVLRGH